MLLETEAIPADATLSGRVIVDPDGNGASIDGESIDCPEPEHLIAYLGHAIYDRLHAGRQATTTQPGRVYRDGAFEADLAGVVPSQQRVVEVQRSTDPKGKPVILLEGVRVSVPEVAVVEEIGQDRVRVSMPAVRQGASPGFLYYSGPPARASRGLRTLRLYVHLRDQSFAVEAWRTVLGVLESRGEPYSAKVLSHGRHFPRRDAIVAYLHGWSLKSAKAAACSLEGLAGVGEETSVFAERILPGIALAEEHEDPRPGKRPMSFGQQRAGVYAAALVDSVRNGIDLEVALRAECLRGRVDPERPAFNSAAPTELSTARGAGR